MDVASCKPSSHHFRTSLTRQVSTDQPSSAVTAPCVTCTKLFDRQEVSITELEPDPIFEDKICEVVGVDKNELRASVEGGCDWCNVQWQSLQCILKPEVGRDFTFEETELSIWLSWTFDTHNRRSPPKLCHYCPSLQVGLYKTFDFSVLVKPVSGIS